MRRALAFSFVVATMIIAAPAFGAVVYSNPTLTYGAPGDLGNAASIQQNTSGGTATLLTTSSSLTSNSGPALTSLAAFQALSGVQVVNFNSITTPDQSPLSTIVANYDGTHNITFSAPTVPFLYGYDAVSAGSGGNRLAFSGSSIDSDVRVVGATGTTPGDANALNQWLNLSVAVSDPTAGLTAFGACFAHRNDQGGGPPINDVVIYLSNGSTQVATIPGAEIPANGGTNADAVWFGYQAPAGLGITGIVIGQETTGGGSNNPGMDDLSFVVGPVTAPEPASLSFLGLGALALIRRRNK